MNKRELLEMKAVKREFAKMRFPEPETESIISFKGLVAFLDYNPWLSKEAEWSGLVEMLEYKTPHQRLKTALEMRPDFQPMEYLHRIINHQNLTSHSFERAVKRAKESIDPMLGPEWVEFHKTWLEILESIK